MVIHHNRASASLGRPSCPHTKSTISQFCPLCFQCHRFCTPTPPRVLSEVLSPCVHLIFLPSFSSHLISSSFRLIFSIIDYRLWSPTFPTNLRPSLFLSTILSVMTTPTYSVATPQLYFWLQERDEDNISAEVLASHLACPLLFRLHYYNRDRQFFLLRG